MSCWTWGLGGWEEEEEEEEDAPVTEALHKLRLLIAASFLMSLRASRLCL